MDEREIEYLKKGTNDAIDEAWGTLSKRHDKLLGWLTSYSRCARIYSGKDSEEYKEWKKEYEADNKVYRAEMNDTGAILDALQKVRDSR